MAQNDYHKYVIKDGELVAKFEEMYRECADPWNQSNVISHDAMRNLISVMLPSWCNKASGQSGRVVELGCGAGYFTKLIKDRNPYWDVLGVDISKTAVEIANKHNDRVQHIVLDVMSPDFFDVGILEIKRFKPDAIIMCQLSWYILPRLTELIEQFRQLNSKIIHQLTFYPPGKQTFGLDYFDSPDALRRYLGIVQSDLDLREVKQNSVSEHLVVF
jgi:SAM-dependent methyltransferase